MVEKETWMLDESMTCRGCGPCGDLEDVQQALAAAFDMAVKGGPTSDSSDGRTYAMTGVGNLHHCWPECSIRECCDTAATAAIARSCFASVVIIVC